MSCNCSAVSRDTSSPELVFQLCIKAFHCLFDLIHFGNLSTNLADHAKNIECKISRCWSCWSIYAQAHSGIHLWAKKYGFGIDWDTKAQCIVEENLNFMLILFLIIKMRVIILYNNLLLFHLIYFFVIQLSIIFRYAAKLTLHLVFITLHSVIFHIILYI